MSTPPADQLPRPPAEDCAQASEVGRVHFDEVNDIWYECMHDKRRDVISWVIVPSNEE